MQQEYFGIGCVGRLWDVLAQIKPSSIFFVHSEDSYHSSGAEEKIFPLLLGCQIAEFTDFSSNAKIGDLEKGLALFRKKNCDLTLAVGGGSAIDLAKGITILANNQGAIEDYFSKKQPLQARTIPFVAIPTTAGTGSEATHFAVIYIGKTKHSLAHPSLVPDYAIIDPGLTFSLPSYQTACTGIDALAQAVESYWSIHSTEESKQYAQQAIALALTHLEKAANAPASEDRIGMAKAANLAGKAINISFTTACHAISYPITSYFVIPHGHAVALTLPEMVLYNAGVTNDDCLDKRGPGYVRKTMEELYALFKVQSAEEMKSKLETLLDSIGLQRKLSSLGIKTNEDVGLIIKNGFNPDRVKNNPRLVTEESLRTMLYRLK